MALSDFSLLETRPVFTRRRISSLEIEMCYMDGTGKIILSEHTDNKWTIKIYGAISGNLKAIVAREILKNDRMSINMEISYQVSRSETYSSSAQELLTDNVWESIYRFHFMKPKLSITRTFGMWRADLISSEHQVNIFKGEKNFYPNVVSEDSSDSISSFKRLALHELNLKEIHDLITEVFQVDSKFFSDRKKKKTDEAEINTQIESMLVSSLLDTSALGYIDDEEFEDYGLAAEDNHESDSESSEEMIENDNVWEFSTMLSPEFVEEMVQMSLIPEEDWASDCMAVNSLIMSSLAAAVRDEVRYSISKFLNAKMSAKEIVTILSNLVIRDLFFKEENDINEFFAVLISLAVIKMSAFSQRMVDSMEVKRISAKALTSIQRTFYWKQEEDIDMVLDEIRD
jgi:hypothetical protein